MLSRLMLFSAYFAFAKGNQFLPFQFDILNHTLFSPRNMISLKLIEKTTHVFFQPECVLNCVDTPWCRSLNFKLTAKDDGLHVCEMFSVDKFSNERDLRRNQDYIHYSIKVSGLIWHLHSQVKILVCGRTSYLNDWKAFKTTVWETICWK